MRAVAVVVCLLSLFACGNPQGSEPSSTTVVAPEPSPAPTPEPAATPPTPAPAPTPEPAAAPPAEPAAPAPTAVEARSFAEASNAFATDLWRQVRARPGNLTVSPASIWIALAMTHEGARTETAAEMARVMHMPADADGARAVAGRQLVAWNAAGAGPLTLRVVNRLFGEKTAHFEPAFLRTTGERWQAPLEPTDFKNAYEPARVHINGWVAEQTHDRIRNLLPPGSTSADTRLILTNAIYFLGKWVHAFDHERTHDEGFFVARGRSVQVPMMGQTESFGYAEADGVQLLEMPYRGGDFAMTVILPRAVDGLGAVEARLDPRTLQGWLSALQPKRVIVSFPKFTIDPADPMPLKDVLGALGMHLAFQPLQADFTGIANPPAPADRLNISEVFHKAFVKVDEDGTEAAAATAVTMVRGGGMPEPLPELRADHPFLFLLRDTRTGVILFVGRVTDPTPPSAG